MNKKGFTLIELLGVIIILSLLATLASTSVTKVVKDSKSDLYNAQLESIKSAAKSWGADNLNSLPSNGECKYLTLKDLKEYGLLEPSIKDPRNNKEFSDDMKIKITSEITKYGTTNVVYEVDSDNISVCEIAAEKTLDRICKYDKTSTVPEKTAGAKYSCEVKSGTSYNFYVLTTPTVGDTTVNLIMDRNICEDGAPPKEGKTCLVAWQTSGLNTDGPVTIMNHLYNATKDWTNIQNIEMNYIDEGNTGDYGYGTIVTTDNKTKITKRDGTAVTVLTDQESYNNLKARLPFRSEVSSYDKTNAYLYDYLNQSGTIQTNAISGVYGYWTLSSIVGNSNGALRVRYDGDVGTTNVAGVSGVGYGVRAVINLKI